MIDFLKTLHPVWQSLIATTFTWGITALGASVVFFVNKVSRKLLDGSLGFASGVMLAASFWSLLTPSIQMSKGAGVPLWVPPVMGFLFGAFFLWGIDQIIPHLHKGPSTDKVEGVPTGWKRTTLLFVAMTLHNIPEGLSIGIAFGAVAAGVPSASLLGAVTLAVGIGIQDFPEGMAVSLPLRCEGMSKFRSFWYGQLSGLAEPIGGLVGAAAVLLVKPILPYALSFAAGIMFFVIVEDLIPECQREGNTDVATMGAVFGFAMMMALEISFG